MAVTPEPAQTYRKHFIALESNPEVFTELCHKLGVDESLEFRDVLSLDDADVLGHLPRPAYALILVFPTPIDYEKKLKDEKSDDRTTDSAEADDHILFFRQTIN